jgi:2-phosphosulfolactate phosphatase
MRDVLRERSNHMDVPGWATQAGFEVRFDWGLPGVAASGVPGGVVIIVDVLRFTTAVEAAVGAGLTVFPYRWRDDSAVDFAASVGGVLADNPDVTGSSLSPIRLLKLKSGTAVVLPSPNGSTCAVEASDAGATVVAGCLRNASAVARWARSQQTPVAVVAAGERWPDQSLRPAVEDLLGAGAILSRLRGSTSPEARAAVGAFRALADDLPQLLEASASGRELIEKGWADDVDYAAQLDVSGVVPVLRNGAFREPSVTAG